MGNKIFNMKKISKKLLKKLDSTIQTSIKESYTQTVGKNEYTIEHWCDYNEDVSNKIISLVSNIVKYKDNSTINISIKESNIFIHVGSVSNIKGSKPTKSGGLSGINGTVTINNPLSLSSESYLEINLIKDRGFVFNYKYNNQVYFKDDKIYDSLYDIIVSKYNEISSYKFNKSYKEILDLSGLNREYNLENLLDTE
jgi:hypothetical protein